MIFGLVYTLVNTIAPAFGEKAQRNIGWIQNID